MLGFSQIAALPAVFTVTVVAAAITPSDIASAQSENISCGATVTHSIRLTHDLTNCTGDGLVVEADDLIVDLNGHTLSSISATDPLTLGNGIVVDDNHHNVTVENGIIIGFKRGVELSLSTRCVVRRIQIPHTAFAGVLLAAGSRNTVDHVTARNIGPDSGPGIFLFESHANTLVHNTVSHAGDAIAIDASNRNLVERNTLAHNGAGISLGDGAAHNNILHNQTRDNADTGILLDGSSYDLIQDNIATTSAFAGIAVGNSVGVTVRHNRTTGNGGAGVAVVDVDRHARIIDNTANNNGFSPPGCVPDCPLLNDGIFIAAPRTLLRGNTANHNADLGIDAVAGVIDGGYNRAHRNGNPAQCLGVVCS